MPELEQEAKQAAARPLLDTKLYAPRRRPGLVSRPALVDRLEQGTLRTLTLVSAPPGFGKTTLLAEWLPSESGPERPVAWVSLDRGDNDSALFWAYVIAALQKVTPGVGDAALSMLSSPEPPQIDALLTTLINEINSVDRDFALALDDFHVIESRAVLDGMAFLLEHLPPQMHVVIASRAVPALPLSRLRGRGELTELRATDLRFTADEAASFLNKVMGLNLSAEDVKSLETRIEGWIAGLQLAALSMQGRDDVQGFIKTFAGDDRYIVDYLVEEVLQRQPEHVQQFLLQTSVLDRLTGPLCDAVTGRDDSSDLLETLERGNLFVVPLDDKRQWYRYHHLFADVLRSHLMERQPGSLSALRSRASAWYEEQGMPAEAIEQAMAAEDHETVARLLAANFDEFERTGHYASLARWAASLPEEMVRVRPRLALFHAMSSWRSESHNATARRLVSWAEEAIKKLEESGGLAPHDDTGWTYIGPAGLEALKGEAFVIRLFSSSRQMTVEQMMDTAQQALDLLPSSKSYIRGMIHMINAGLQGETDDLQSMIPSLENATEEARRARNLPLLSSILELHGNVYVGLGQFEEGLRLYEEAISVGESASSESAWISCAPHGRMADLSLELGDLENATRHATEAAKLVEKSPARSHILYARAAAIDVFLATGETDPALAQLERMEGFIAGSSNSRHDSFMSSVKLTFGVRTGDLSMAADAVRDRGLSPGELVSDQNDEETLAYGRYLIALSEFGDAARVLSELVPTLRARGRVRLEAQGLALLAMARELSGERALALEALGRATMLGEPGRFNRTFTAEGPVMDGLLEALADAVRRGRGPAECGSSGYLAFLLDEAGVKTEKPAATVPEQEPTRSVASLPEPLSERELEVLEMIASGASNQQIAERLVVSMSTVKSHINRTYRKLGARSRTQAVAMGRQLGLI